MQILSVIAAILPNTGAPENPAYLAQTGLTFFGTWISRIGGLVEFIGAAGTLVGAVMFGFSVKDNNAVGKVTALKTFAAGAIWVSVSGILHTFV